MWLATLLAAVSMDAARAYSFVSYIAGDYPAAVGVSRELISKQEFDEQRIFAEDAAQDLAAAGAGDLAAQARVLAGRIAERAAPAEVVPLAHSLAQRIAGRFELEMLPRRAPDLRRGRLVYRQSCAACHGRDGTPRDQILGLSTRPPAFASHKEVARLSPRRIFAAVSFGVPGTAMPSFGGAIEDDGIWDVAFAALLMACSDGERVQGEKVARSLPRRPDWLQLAVRSDEQIRAALSASPFSPADRDALLCALRAKWSEPGIVAAPPSALNAAGTTSVRP